MTASVAAVDPTPFGKYRPIAVLGRGGMATVYLAASSGPAGFTKLVVVKELRHELSEDPEFMQMFLDEARLAARLHHPNVVQTYEVTGEGGRHAIVMEYLDGQPLSRLRSKFVELGADGVAYHLRILCDALAGLQYAHDLADFDGTPLHVVHRDVSPHNVFVTYTGETKVVDFGIAKAADSSSQTRVGTIKGKIAYMAPEQATSQPVDRRADVFAVGVMLWEAVAGRRMWKGLEEVGVMSRLMTGDIPRLSSVKPDAPGALDAICARALAWKPQDRYATADEMRRDLEQYLATLPARPGAREVGELVARMFEEERAKIRAIVDEQLRALRAAPTGEGRAVPLAHLTTSLTGSSAVGGTGSAVPAPSGSVQFVPAMVHPSGSGSSSSTMSAALTSALSQNPPAPMIAPPSRSAGIALLLAGAAVLVFVVAVAGIGIGRMTSAAGVTQATTGTAQMTAAATGAGPAVTGGAARSTITVTINVKPQGAKLWLDDIPLDKTVLEVPADGSRHVLKIDAPGHRAETHELVYDVSRNLEVKLERKGAASSPGTTHGVPGTTHGTVRSPQGGGPSPDSGMDLGF
jgi:serine/threonine-protein kinase